jgi:predicted AlkP superfamily pyrophosphatase or phosphodiesterase
MKDRIKLLAKWLNEVDHLSFSYDPYSSGSLEQAMAYSQAEICNKIGDYLEEILKMDEEQLRDNLEN